MSEPAVSIILGNGVDKQEVAPTQGDAAQRPFDSRVVDLDASVIAIAG